MATGQEGQTTLERLATLAGVSVSTASRALNDHPSISLRTKQRIWALAHDHDYPFRSHMPIAPIGGEGAIVIVLPHVLGRPLPLSHPFFLELIAGIGEAARARDCDFTVSHTAPSSREELVAAATTNRSNGTIFLGQHMMHDALNQLTETSARFVVWGAQLPGQLYPSVGSDNLLGGRRAAAHLLRLGRKQLLFIGSDDPEARLRRRAYRDAVRDAGLDLDPDLAVAVDFRMESADEAVSRLIRQGVAFDGVVASSDLIALGAMRALRRAGRSVPEDVSVVGYDDMLLSRLSTPTLTTIRQDTQEAGRLLVSRILDAGGDNSPALLPTDLIVRESCGA